MGGRQGRVAGAGMRAGGREEPQGRIRSGRLADDRHDVGVQQGAGGREDLVGGIARAAQHESGIAVARIRREGDDLEQVEARRHQAFSGL
jgi:hypothetical protein